MVQQLMYRISPNLHYTSFKPNEQAPIVNHANLWTTFTDLYVKQILYVLH